MNSSRATAVDMYFVLISILPTSLQFLPTASQTKECTHILSSHAKAVIGIDVSQELVEDRQRHPHWGSAAADDAADDDDDDDYDDNCVLLEWPLWPLPR